MMAPPGTWQQQVCEEKPERVTGYWSDTGRARRALEIDSVFRTVANHRIG